MDGDTQNHPVSEHTGEHGALSAQQRLLILEEMRRVVQSGAFRSSKRCQEFLTHVVERAVEGRDDLLKERTIGIEVFHRHPTYEPNFDAIVRVRATEVRKRLAQYYDHAGNSSPIRIELLPGSYVPDFLWIDINKAPPPIKSGRKLITVRSALLALVITILLAISAWLLLRPKPTLVETFWGPDIASSRPVLICIRQPVVYHLSRRAHERYINSLPRGQFPSPYVLPLRQGDIDASDIIPVPDQYVTVGGAQVAARLSAMFAFHNKQAQIRVGSDFSFVDLKESPTVLVGAVPHQWTERLTGKLPFVMVQEGHRRGIHEQTGEQRTWFVDGLQPNGRTNEDYALVTRIFMNTAPEPLVTLAGVTQYGSDAASEFVIQEDALAQALQKAPADWAKRNMQLLLHLEVIGTTPGKPEVLATRFW